LAARGSGRRLAGKDGEPVGDSEPGTEKIPEGDAELGVGLHQAEENIAAIAAIIAVGTAADVSLGDVAADVVLGAVRVQRNLLPYDSARLGLPPQTVSRRRTRRTDETRREKRNQKR
jgi:hypothetical protein